MEICSTLELVAITFFNGDLEVYELPLVPIITPYIGVDMRAEVLGSNSKQTQFEFDMGELKKLPPLNDFIKKRCV